MKRSVLLIGLDKNRKVLLHHKTADAPTNANLWVLLGGSIEEGESPYQAMRREIKEELGTVIDPLFFKSYLHTETWGEVERNIFYAPIDTSLDELKSVQQEGDDMGFFDENEIDLLLINKNHLKIIKEFLHSLPSI